MFLPATPDQAPDHPRHAAWLRQYDPTREFRHTMLFWALAKIALAAGLCGLCYWLFAA